MNDDVERCISEWVDIVNERDATIAALQAKLEDLTAKYQNLVAWYDKQNGTPCEQVRHKQEVADLQAELERVRGQYAELGKMVLALPKVEG